MFHLFGSFGWVSIIEGESVCVGLGPNLFGHAKYMTDDHRLSIYTCISYVDIHVHVPVCASFRQFYPAAGGTSSSGTAGQGLNWNSSSQDSWWRDKLEVEPPLCISWKKPWSLVIGSRKNQSILSKTGGSHSPRGGHPKGSPTKGWLSDPVDHPVGQEEKQRSQQLENENLGIRATHFTGCFMEKGWHSNWFSIDGEETRILFFCYLRDFFFNVMPSLTYLSTSHLFLW